MNEPNLQSLTPREREVLERIAAGESSKMVAASLGISAQTVKVHRKHIHAKLGVHCLAEALRFALQAA